jgi:hypothetical protein
MDSHKDDLDHNRSTRRVIAIIGLAIFASCQKSVPSAPSEFSPGVGGIALYEHADYLGESAHIWTDVSDLRDLKGPCAGLGTCVPYGACDTTFSWSDCISSVRVAPGWRATFYQDDDFRDDHLEVTQDIPNLEATHGCSSRGFNDCVTSIRVFRP